MAVKKSMEKCFIICTKKGGYALTVENGSTENGALIRLKGIDASPAQQWNAVASGDFYKLVNKASGKVLDVVHAGAESGCAVHQWDDAGSDSQLWSFASAKTGRYKIISKLSGKCLDIAGMAVGEDAMLQIWDDVDGENQKWLLAEDGAPKAPAKRAVKKAAPAADEAAPKAAKPSAVKKTAAKPKADATEAAPAKKPATATGEKSSARKASPKKKA